MAHKKNSTKFKGGERGEILCVKHGTPVVQRASYGHGYYGFICPTCRAEREVKEAAYA